MSCLDLGDAAQGVLELAPGFEQAPLGCAFRDVEDRRRLTVGVALDLAQQKDLAIQRTECRQGPLERDPQRVVAALRLQQGSSWIDLLFDAANRPAPARVVAGVEQDAVDPRPQLGVAAEGVPAAISLEKRLLHSVLGV